MHKIGFEAREGMTGKRGCTGDDEPDLWDLVTADVTPLKGRKPKAQKTQHDAPAAAPQKPLRQKAAPHRPAVQSEQHQKAPQGRDIDLRTRQRLTRGQMDVQAVLDLHGHGQAAARERLIAFLLEAHARTYRCVLVITGKGKGGEGVLRTRLREWLGEPPLAGIVLEASPARPKDGGSGAFYVLLRRSRTL